jgi:glutamine synthetase
MLQIANPVSRHFFTFSKEQAMTTRQVALEAQALAFAAPGSFRVERPASPKDVVSLIEKHHIQIVDLKFTDLPGLWQHFSITLPEIH